MTAGPSPVTRLRRAVVRRARAGKPSAASAAPVAAPGPPPRDPDVHGQTLQRKFVPRRLAQAPQPRRLLVLHVPKTGGTSLRGMFAPHVPAEETFLSTGQAEWLDRSLAELRGYRLFIGHNFTVPLTLMPEDDWVTVLPVRDPVSWWRSYYKFTRRRYARAGVDKPILSQTMDDWLREQPDGALGNPQTSWLLTQHVLTHDHPLCRPGRAVDSALAVPRDPAAVAELAANLVARVSVAGTTDDLLGMYRRACELMGWEPQRDTALQRNRASVAPELTELSDEQLERLHRLNGLDRRLYALAQARAAELPADVPAGQPR